MYVSNEEGEPQSEPVLKFNSGSCTFFIVHVCNSLIGCRHEGGSSDSLFKYGSAPGEGSMFDKMTADLIIPAVQEVRCQPCMDQ